MKFIPLSSLLLSMAFQLLPAQGDAQESASTSPDAGVTADAAVVALEVVVAHDAAATTAPFVALPLAEAAAPAAAPLAAPPNEVRSDVARADAPSLATAPPTSPQAATTAPAAPSTDRVSVGPKGFTAQSEDSRFVFNVRLPVMFDYKATLGEALPKASDAFYPRFFGPIFTITLYKAVTGKLIVGFQDRSVTVVNAWMDFVAHSLLHLRLGKVLTPIALERQALPLKAVLLEHGLASQLLPVSEFGAQLWGATEDKLFEYQLMVGNGAPANQHYEVDLDKYKDGIARAYLRPFARTGIAALAGFGLGFGASYGKHQGAPNAPGTAVTTETTVARTLGGRTFFSTLVNPADPAGTVFADGKVVRIVPQLGYLAGAISLYAEYIRLTERLNKGGIKDTLTHQSYHAVLAAVLTGENAVLLDIVAPKRPLDIAAGQWGALELVARFERIEFDKATFPTFANPERSARDATAIGGGLNWIPTEIIRLMLNFERTKFGAANGARKLKSENALGVRLQALF